MPEVQEYRSRARPLSWGFHTRHGRLFGHGSRSTTDIARTSRSLRRARCAAFSLIDVCVVVALLALLAGVLVPTMSGEIERSHRANALSDVHRIAVAVNHYLNDLQRAPNRVGGQAIHYLHTAGEEPLDNPFAEGPGASIDDLFISPTNSSSDWEGPYLGQSPIDPWGRQYIINVHAFDDDSERVWVISAGENGIIETMPSDSAPVDDDIGMYIR